ncbi:DNA polymerase IV [Anaerorhabdus sp.]|uniref:DNA polymerase Y family protein n=1 Tax=Anaerorhabdus sp. TaxID=1872524 RepID=UPI002B208789|nr:DNA polymerase IV [Anaerorhabdus sp.]MEA4874025.1 DNA polymerase IV [Anaerorhabdus sp.]
MSRIILHSDLNCFYASVEMLYHPEYRHVPLAVCGDIEERHGIILTKNKYAKIKGVKTGEPIWQAKQKCPNLICIKANFPLYLRYAKSVQKIYERYSNRVESFGIDESWIDISDCHYLYKSVEELAIEIKETIKFELGLTVSIGISYNKVYAKLASDLADIDSFCTLYPNEKEKKVFPLPVSQLLFVGRSNEKKLKMYGIYTIGELASTPLEQLKRIFGKVGEILYSFANGIETSEVAITNTLSPMKSIGNSTTCPKDLTTLEEVKIVFIILIESVCARIREQGLYGKTVTISIRDSSLHTITRQMTLPLQSDCTDYVLEYALLLFEKNYSFHKSIRGLGVRLSNFTENPPIQQSSFFEKNKDCSMKQLEVAIDEIRNRFGHYAVQRGCVLQDNDLNRLDPKSDHVIFPESYFK